MSEYEMTVEELNNRVVALEDRVDILYNNLAANNQDVVNLLSEIPRFLQQHNLEDEPITCAVQALLENICHRPPGCLAHVE